MKLLRLELQDFQGLRRFTMDAGGENCTVYGTNGTGKTTIANAISWLLFDKPYTGEKGYSPKTTDEDGQELHHLDHKATATFLKDDGSQITLSRVYHEVWKKKRGSSTEEFSGHVTDAYIDGIPVSAGEYKRTLEDICIPERTKILTDPRYFAKTMHWEDRRQTLLEMCGDITDAEVIGSSEGLADLWGYLRKPGTNDQFYTVAEFLRIAASRKAELNRELTIIPARIDETMKSIPDLTGQPDEEAITQKISDLDRQKMDLMEQASAAGDDEQIRILRRRMDDVESRISRAGVAYREAMELKHKAANDAIREMGRAIAAADSDIIAAENTVRILSEQIDTMTREREALLRRHKEVKSAVWTGDTVCAACGQPLPEEKIQEARERFYIQRSRDLAEINEKGQLCRKELIEEKTAQVQAGKEAIEEAKARKASAEAELQEARTAVAADPPFEETEEGTALHAELAAVSAELAGANQDTSRSKEAARKAVDELSRQISEAQEVRLAHVTARKRRERLEELEAQEKEIAAEYEKFDRGVFLCEEFTRAKVAMLDERINSRFRAVRFRLFKQQINGGLADCCDVLCPTSSGLTPYDSANNAAQINAGIEIAAALGRHWGQTMPILIDNAESVVDLIDTDAQTIRLVVSEQDKRLRVTTDGEITMEQRGVA